MLFYYATLVGLGMHWVCGNSAAIKAARGKSCPWNLHGFTQQYQITKAPHQEAY